jgi:hypothetical protein
VKFYIMPTNPDGTPADPAGVTVDGSTNAFPATTTTTVQLQYSMGTITRLGGDPFPVAIGIAFPELPVQGDWALRMDSFPNRLYQYDNEQWVLDVLNATDVIFFEPLSTETVTTNSTITVDSTYINADEAPVSPRADGYTMGYLTGDGIAPNGLPVTPGVSFPIAPIEGQYCLRLDYFPNRLFRYNGAAWVKIEDNVRTNLTNGPMNQTLRSSFVNNTYTVSTTDMGNIPSRQSLSEILKPRADNGDDNGNKPPNPRPPGR